MTQSPGWPDGVGLCWFDTLDSTNEEARRRAQTGERGPLWIVAGAQTSGRGRRGRSWVSKPGNLFATLLIEASLPGAAQLSFAAGLAVAETIDAYASASDVTLKWPNDVLLKGRKLAGILLETAGTDRVAIGVGINLADHPSGTPFPATSVASAMGAAPDPESALHQLASRMAAWYEIWRHSGFAPVRTAWLARASSLGSVIRVQLAERELDGVFETLDEDGALLLRSPEGGLMRITAGDVFFRN